MSSLALLHDYVLCIYLSAFSNEGIYIEATTISAICIAAAYLNCTTNLVGLVVTVIRVLVIAKVAAGTTTLTHLSHELLKVHYREVQEDSR